MFMLVFRDPENGIEISADNESDFASAYNLYEAKFKTSNKGAPTPPRPVNEEEIARLTPTQRELHADMESSTLYGEVLSHITKANVAINPPLRGWSGEKLGQGPSLESSENCALGLGPGQSLAQSGSDSQAEDATAQAFADRDLQHADSKIAYYRELLEQHRALNRKLNEELKAVQQQLDGWNALAKRHGYSPMPCGLSALGEVARWLDLFVDQTDRYGKLREQHEVQGRNIQHLMEQVADGNKQIEKRDQQLTRLNKKLQKFNSIA